MAPFAELAVAIAADAQEYYAGLEETVGKTKSWAGNVAGVASAALGGALLGAATAVAGGVAAIGGAALDVSRQTEEAAAAMAASLDVPAERAQEFADIAQAVYGNNFAESVTGAGEVVAEAYRRMGDVGDEQLQRVTEQAFALADNFETGPTEAISAAQTLMDNFGVSSDEAFDLIAKGFQRGLNRSGDFLDTINEYSVQFGGAGASAAEFLGLLESGLEGGALGTDKAADLFKEFFIRIQDGSDTTAKGLTQLGLDSEAITAGLSDGSLTAADAFRQVSSAVNAIEDPILRSQAGVALFGTQFEDLGQSLGSIDLIPDSFEDIAGAADQLNAKYNNFGDLFAGIWRKAVVSVTPATDKLLELANDAMPLVEAGFNFLADKVPPAIDFVVDAVDVGVAFIKGLFDGPLKDGLDGGVGAFETVQDWIDTNMPLIQQTIETVLAAITGFWDSNGARIMSIVDGFLSIVRTLFDTYLNNALDIVTAVMQLINGDVEGAGETLKGIAERTMSAFLSIVSDYIGMVKDAFGDVDWGAVGRSIIDGIVAGLSGAGHLLVSAAQGAAGGAVQGIKDLLGIRSPSQVMADEVGLPMVEGIIRGFADNLPALEGLSLDMSGVGAGGGGAGFAPAAITINIYTDDARTAGDSVVQSLRAYGLAA
jgi:phage-related protein